MLGMSGRMTQPYRRGARHPGMPLQAMLMGKPFFMPNPQDVARATALLAAANRRRRNPRQA